VRDAHVLDAVADPAARRGADLDAVLALVPRHAEALEGGGRAVDADAEARRITDVQVLELAVRGVATDLDRAHVVAEPDPRRGAEPTERRPLGPVHLHAGGGPRVVEVLEDGIQGADGIDRTG